MSLLARLSFAVATAALVCGSAQAALLNIDPPWVDTPGTYTFSGTCQDCPAPQDATGTLTYAIGSGPFNLPEVSFTYQSSLFDLTSVWVEVYRLDIAALPGPAAAYILFGAMVDGDEHTFSLTSDALGNWQLDDEFVPATLHEDVGVAGNWVRAPAGNVPEPASALLVGLGLWAATSRRRRSA